MGDAIVDDELIVRVNQGQLKGIKRKSEFSQKEYCSFLGIPFALPPVGKLRFKPPVKGEKWDGILDATQEKSPCLQYSFYTNQILGDEDCLYLYIHTPEIPCRINKPKAVIVGLHQGGFNCGSGSSDHHGSPDYLIHHDIIYVTFNFRLHALGFLNLGIEECSGNAGLKDMVLAFKWINENISAFGGDPKNVTALASSSTASALHHLMLFSQLKGLIHKVIMLGCYGFSDPCSYQENGPELAFEFAKILGCRSANPHVVHKFLMAQNQHEILRAQGLLRNKIIFENPGKFSMTPFFMSVEIKCEHAIITQSPRNLMDSIEPLPLLFGKCEHEAILMFYYNHIKTVKNDLLKVMKKNLWQFETDDCTLLEITKKIKRFYFHEDKSFEDLSVDAEKFYQDLWYFEFYPTFINLIAKKQSTPAIYMYNFTYDGELNYQKKTFLPKLFCPANALKSAVHADDSYYWMAGFHSHVPEKERYMVNQMGQFYTNFAKTGDPNNEGSDFHWESYSLDNPCYMQFDNPLEMKHGRFNEDRMQFWEQISSLLEKSNKKYGNKN